MKLRKQKSLNNLLIVKQIFKVEYQKSTGYSISNMIFQKLSMKENLNKYFCVVSDFSSSPFQARCLASPTVKIMGKLIGNENNH